MRRTVSTAFRGTLTENRTPGSTLTFTRVDGTTLYVIGRVGPSYGRMQVTVDGVSTLVDTGFYQGKRATTIRDRIILFSKALTPGPHTVTITNAGLAARVTLGIDGLDIRR